MTAVKDARQEVVARAYEKSGAGFTRKPRWFHPGEAAARQAEKVCRSRASRRIGRPASGQKVEACLQRLLRRDCRDHEDVGHGEHIAQFEVLTNSKTVDSRENVAVLIPDGLGVFYLGEREADGLMSCTNAVQTYVDLFHCGGRGVETAEALVERRLRRKWGSVQK